MRVLIIGATGTIGRELTAYAMRQGHQVTALVRDPAKLESREGIHVIEGDALKPETLNAAVPGHDAVLVALGAGMKGSVRAEGTRNIVAAMERAGVSRLICLSSLGVGDSRGNLDFYWKYIMFGLLLRRAYADHVAQEAAVTESNLAWTIVRPGAFTDGPMTTRYRHGFSPTTRDIAAKISRADVAHFMLDQLGHDTYLGRTPGLSY